MGLSLGTHGGPLLSEQEPLLPMPGALPTSGAQLPSGSRFFCGHFGCCLPGQLWLPPPHTPPCTCPLLTHPPAALFSLSVTQQGPGGGADTPTRSPRWVLSRQPSFQLSRDLISNWLIYYTRNKYTYQIYL